LPRPGRDIRARDAAREFFERHFEACRILVEPGLLTSYFEPVLEGSRQPSPAFPIPVYRRPDDLEPLPDGHCLRERGLTAGQRAGEDFRPYFTRAEIEAGAIAGRGLELLYVSDPIMAFVMHVQGSGAVNLAEGGVVRLSFDGKNGHPYTSVGKLMIERGALSLEEASLERVMDWLRRHPGQSGALLAENKSYIFFKELEEGADAPQGSLGCPLFPGRSLAVDPRYHALGLPIWVSAPQLNYEGQAFRRLMVAQDTGSAISGPQRGDLFAGSGVEAGAIAGRVRQSCEFIVLRPR
jgi:membrane-bound lytic murein transglycosylase A